MEQKEYRRLVTALRARIGLTECQLTRKHPEKINYEAVPSQAMLKYRSVFEQKDHVRRQACIPDQDDFQLMW